LLGAVLHQQASETLVMPDSLRVLVVKEAQRWLKFKLQAGGLF